MLQEEEIILAAADPPVVVACVVSERMNLAKTEAAAWSNKKHYKKESWVTCLLWYLLIQLLAENK